MVYTHFKLLIKCPFSKSDCRCEVKDNYIFLVVLGMMCYNMQVSQSYFLIHKGIN